MVEYFQEPIYYYIRRLVVLHEDAEDVLQEVFIQIYRHWDQFRNESSLSTWIYRIATNESLRLLNSRKKRETVSTEDMQESLISQLRASDYVDYENELAVKFQEAILRLPEKQRLVFNLRYYDELDYEERKYVSAPWYCGKDTFERFLSSHKEDFDISDNRNAQCSSYGWLDE